MRFASLGSGSSGNALVVEAGRTRLLFDCGFRLADTVCRLQRVGLEPHELSAIVVSHEHDDHISGVGPLARKFNLPVWMTYGTLREMNGALADFPVAVIDGHQRFAIGDIEIEPYPAPHDAREPAQFVFSDGARRLGVLTDSGCITRHIETVLQRCDALILECNHDVDMLRNGPYPASLKQRIASRFGHLDNGCAAALLEKLDCSRLRHIIAAHISQQNNTPNLARAALGAALDCAGEWITVANQTDGFSWRDLG